ncbi:MAG: HAD-IC family P-type ATPase, partial [Myxococcales bacterium]
MSTGETGAGRPGASWHALEAPDVVQELGTGPDGLSEAEARRRLETYGPNVLPQRGGDGPLKLLWRQIHNPLIWVLIAAGALALLLGKHADGAIVLAVVVLNTLIGFFQEFRAGKAIEALGRMVPEDATTLRDGRQQRVRADALVPGDVVLLASGDRVPADMRLLETKNLQVEEAALTGESVPVGKALPPVDPSAELGDRTSMVFGGTVVTSGAAKAVVVGTGGNTELGRISHLLESALELQTPLTKQLQWLGRVIAFAIVAISAVLLPVSLWRGYGGVDAMLVAITLAVAAIPEGLPAIVTI